MSDETKCRAYVDGTHYFHPEDGRCACGADKRMADKDAEIARLTADLHHVNAIAAERDQDLARLTQEAQLVRMIAAERDAALQTLAVAQDVAHQYEQERDEALAEVEKQKELYALRVEMEQAAYFPMREERDAMRAERDAAREQAKGLAEALRERVQEHQRTAIYPKHAPTCNCYDLCDWGKKALAAFDKENEHADTE